jgi:2-polyprenyl-3-methyl-5-hydroxy-6-metoxy-1,4-benzoquinol methylase
MTIDYYKYWNKKRKKNDLYYREKISINFLSSVVSKGSQILDAGCGNGKFMGAVMDSFPYVNILGADFSEEELSEAKNNNLQVFKSDFNEFIPFNSDRFNVVYAAEVIEHLVNPDLFLDELYRVLKPEGYLILTTPNLCAWFNRLLFPLGIQPIFVEPSTKSKLAGAGILKNLKRESQPVGHIRIFNFEAIKDLLEMSGFKILKVKGDIFESGLPKSLFCIDKLFARFPTISSGFIILSKKIQNAGTNQNSFARNHYKT